ncbi:MAG: 4Fe-4S dicluster domain-containing protein, partial [Methanosphaera sp.]|nr:4Fe-4S dicluster domain-containing protein [Methanosphaera sp.]
ITIHGYAKLDKSREYITKCPNFIDTYPYGISIGINIPDNIVEYAGSDYVKKYSDTVESINNKLDIIGPEIEKVLVNEGYASRYIKASQIISDDLESYMSHKLVANLANLGWIGKSAMLINPYYGPRIRWATILTDYEVPYATSFQRNHCGNCRLCVVNCPASAFNNNIFDETKPRSVQFDAFKCNDHFRELKLANKQPTCGVCVKVCPWGIVNKKSRKEEV